MKYTKKQIERISKVKRAKKVWERYVKPDTNEPWVGIEIEFFAPDKSKVKKLFGASNIQKYVSLGSDCSICPDDDSDEDYYYTEYELRLCCPEKKVKEVVAKASSLLEFLGAKTNDSCGLHIHIDHRSVINRNPIATYKNLLAIQDILYDVSASHRRNNGYCRKVSQRNFWRALGNSHHECSINTSALFDKETIEVRIFHSTIDCKEIMHFVNLVLGAANNKKVVDPVKNKRDLDKIKSIPVSTRNFAKSKYKKAA